LGLGDITYNEICKSYPGCWREAIKRAIELLRDGKLKCFSATTNFYVPAEAAETFLKWKRNAVELTAGEVEECYFPKPKPEETALRIIREAMKKKEGQT
jgi:hypothetical protein